MTAYDQYKAMLDTVYKYMDCIAVKENPTEEEKMDYHMLKCWVWDTNPSTMVQDILKKIPVE